MTSKPAVNHASGRRREMVAGLVALLLGGVLVLMFARAMADGQTRHQETPFRAILGNARYEALMAGHVEGPHYLGAGTREAPDFTLTKRDGTHFRLSEHRGRVVVVNFWSVTCPPCIRELPTLEQLAHVAEVEWGDVDVVAISTDKDWETLKDTVPANPRMTHLLDPDGKTVTAQFGTTRFPETWIIDREGKIRFRYDGALDWSAPIVLDIIDAYR